MRKVIGALLCMVSIVIPAGLYAKEEPRKDTSKVVISFDLTAEDRFIYEVKVSGGGSLYDGSQRITNGTMAYQLSVGQTKEFRIEPDRGYEIKTIEINGVQQNPNREKIQVAGVSATSILEVQYGKIEEEINSPDVEEKPDATNPSDDTGKPEEQDTSTTQMNKPKNETERFVPVTGDMLKISEYVCLMLIVLYRIYVSRNGKYINTVNVEDIEISKDIKERKKETLKEEKEDER